MPFEDRKDQAVTYASTKRSLLRHRVRPHPGKLPTFRIRTGVLYGKPYMKVPWKSARRFRPRPLVVLPRSTWVILLSAILLIVGFINRQESPTLRVCEDPFYVYIPGTSNTPHIESKWPCYVVPPQYYRPPLPPKERLWSVPRSALGELDTTDPEYTLHLARQRWARMRDDFVLLRPEGGTAGRAFEDNFEYVKILWSSMRRTWRCGQKSTPLMLDMGAGIGSVSAALQDHRGLKGKLKALSYVWPDKYLRSQVIMSHRGVPSFLANFTGQLPFPKHGFDVVHCKWCWHHTIGYDTWLEEVDRLLVPGGYFVFTLSTGGDGILDEEKWEAAVKRRPFQCETVRRIILLCRKKMTKEMHVRRGDYCPRRRKQVMNGTSEVQQPKIRSDVSYRLKTLGMESHRLLNINCPDAELCSYLDESFASVIHVSEAKMSKVVSKLLGEKRRMAMLHDFRENIPVYPRSFDSVNIGCNRWTTSLLNKKEFWIDLHRVLVPGGNVLLMRAFCGWQNLGLIQQSGFELFDQKQKSAMAMMRIAEALLERNAAPDWITRIGIRRLLTDRLKCESRATIEEDMQHKMQMLKSVKKDKIAIKQEKANEQHYELPTEFFLHTLGKRRKYSSCYYESADATLDAAEDSMLRLYCQRSGLRDGMTVLDLGCGWGSLTLYIAENYPNCKITGLSNSWTQREFIESEARKSGYKNVKIITADVNKIEKLEGCNSFDLILSIEMFEHMRNYGALLEKISRWMKAKSKLFVHVFCHSKYIYNFETEGTTNWMGRYFFTGGTMMSDDTLCYFQDNVKVINRWRVDGRHYAQTSEHWLQNFDRNIDKIRPILKSTYADDATRWEAYWRTFYLAVAELFGYNNGQEWHVAHYLFEKR